MPRGRWIAWGGALVRILSATLGHRNTTCTTSTPSFDAGAGAWLSLGRKAAGDSGGCKTHSICSDGVGVRFTGAFSPRDGRAGRA